MDVSGINHITRRGECLPADVESEGKLSKKHKLRVLDTVAMSYLKPKEVSKLEGLGWNVYCDWWSPLGFSLDVWRYVKKS